MLNDTELLQKITQELAIGEYFCELYWHVRKC
jgi:hypothetical protein